ncbi:hypothetical protein HRbin19_01750 [bacterium HR19]|nr:hypothetical protein HRbin19_01750 [bacterium HR19]
MGRKGILSLFLLVFSCASIEKTTYYDFKTTKPKISKEIAKSDISVIKNITPDSISFLITEDITCEEKEKGEIIKYHITNKNMDKSGWIADFVLSSIFGGISFMAFKIHNEGKIFGISRIGETEFSKIKNELLITGIISGGIGGIFAIDFVISPFLAIDTSEEIEREKYERVIRTYECDKKPLDNIPVEISFEKASITSNIKKGVVNLNPQKVSEILKSSSPSAYLTFKYGGVERKFSVDFSMFAPPLLSISLPEKITIYPGENIIDITVKNEGKGTAKNVTLALESEELGLKKKLDLGDIKQGEEKKISVPIFPEGISHQSISRR